MNGRYVCAGLGDAARLRLFGCGERTGARRRMCAAILIGLLAALLPLCAGTARAAMNFSDAVGHWADDEIRAGVEFGYISGFPDNSFQPDNAITRAEFVKAVNAAMGFTELGNIAFLDVSPNDWYYDEVRKAASAGYITGAGNNMFFPQNLITREEAAVVLYRLDNDRRLVTALPFVDNRRISPWALDAVRHAFAMDYMTGSPDPTPPNGPPRPGVAVAIPIAPLWFYPNNNDLNVNPVAPPNSGNLKRAEAVSILNRFIKIDRNHRMITELSALYATDLTAYFSVRSHTAGRLFWEIIPASYPAPDAQQIAGGLMANGQPAPLKDDLTLTANRETKFNIFLPHDNTYYANIPEYNGAYTLYAVVRVGNGVNMRLSVVASVDFSTGDTGDWAEDWLAPLNVRAVTANTAVMDFTSSESGNLYYVVMPRTRGVPTQADIFAGRGWNMDPADNQNVGNGVAAVRGVAGAVTLTGLKPGTDYTVYAFVIKDQERFFPAGRYPNWRSDDATALGAISNVSQDVLEALGPGYLSKVVSFSFKTQGQSRPALASVRARFDDNNMLEIDVAASGAVNLYYIVLQESAGAVPPTPVELKNGAGRAAGSLTVANIPANGGTLTIPGGFIAAAEIVGPAPLTKYIFDTPYRLYAVVEGMGAGGDSPAEFSDVVWSDVFTKTQPSSTLANIQIFAIAWNPPPKDPIFGLNAVNPAAQFNPNTYNYPGPGNAGVKVPNSYKQIRVTPTLPANAPANTSIRVNGTMLPASGFIDLTMPAVAGTPFEVKVDVSAPGAQTVSYTVLLKEDAPSVPQLYVADAMDPNPQPDGNGSYEVRLQPGVAQRDVSVRIDIDPEMIGAEFSVNGNVIGPVVRPPNAFNSWQVTIPLNASSPTDVTIRVAGPTQNPETRTYTLRIHH